MIDLESFCANEWELRTYLQRPWRDGEWVYATNGHMMVRVPADAAPDAAVRAANQPNNPPDMFRKMLDDHQGEFLVMPPLPAETACDSCGGSGTFGLDDEKEECATCLGTKHAFTRFALGDVGFNLHYLHQLAGLPQCRIRTHGDKQPAAVVFDGGHALVMPMVVRPGVAE